MNGWETLAAIAGAPTLWQPLTGFALGALASLGVALWPLLRMQRRRSGSLAHDERGAAAAVDFVLTLPIFITFVSLAIQFAVLLNATLVIHYAAFSAARSARAWVVEEAATSPLPLSSLPIAMPVSGEVRQHAESAARMALVAVSPSDPEIAHGGSAPEQTMRAIATAGGLQARGDAFVAKAGYAFDPQNSTVEVEARWRNGAPEVTASVSYRIHTGILAGRALGSDRGDGVRALPARAEVTLQ